jgi:hypothetical protein
MYNLNNTTLGGGTKLKSNYIWMYPNKRRLNATGEKIVPWSCMISNFGSWVIQLVAGSQFQLSYATPVKAATMGTVDTVEFCDDDILCVGADTATWQLLLRGMSGQRKGLDEDGWGGLTMFTVSHTLEGEGVTGGNVDD